MQFESLLLGFFILSSSFWGSWHCAAMCSPVVSLMAQRKTLWSYHMGRGLSYVMMGALSGYLSAFFLEHEFYQLRIFFGITFAIILFLMGIQTLRYNKKFDFNFPWLHRFYSNRTPGFILGLITIFLPCGWLYSYVLAAMATRSPASGALVMAIFWLGGLPALSAVSIFMKKAIASSPKQKQVMAGSVLIVASFYSLLSFYFLH